ncbi:MAG TPA: 6-bladed beta-propeller [Edaphocola sp.]|nr:6-bladed beta-propeller [Edaphocola sp.]
MKKAFKYILYTTIILGSCQNYDKQQIDFIYEDQEINNNFCDTISIDIPSIDSDNFIKTQFDIENVCSRFETIPLETTKESIIGNIDKVIFNDSLIFIGDFFIQKAIFVFNKSGHFIRKISKQGKGPGEYRLNIRNFWIDELNQIIYIVDTDRSQIIYTDFEGNLLKQKSNKIFGSDFYENFNDSIMFFYVNGRKNLGLLKNLGLENNEEYNLYTIINGGIRKKYFPIKSENTILFTSNNNFYPFNNQLFFRPTYDNKIYQFNQDGQLLCKYFFQFHNYKNFEKSIWYPKVKNVNSLIGTIRAQKDHISISRFDINKNHLLIHAICNRYGFNILYNKRTGAIHYGLAGYVNSFGVIVGFNNDCLVFSKDYRVTSINKKSNSSNSNNSENINPTLIFGYLK